VENTLGNLFFANYIQTIGRKRYPNQRFFITSLGRAYVLRLFNSLSTETRMKLIKKRKGWDQLGIEGIRNLIHTKFPVNNETASNWCSKG